MRYSLVVSTGEPLGAAVGHIFGNPNSQTKSSYIIPSDEMLGTP